MPKTYTATEVEEIMRECLGEMDVEEVDEKYTVKWANEKRAVCKVCKKTPPHKMYCKRHCPRATIKRVHIKTANALRTIALERLGKRLSAKEK